MPAFNRSTHAIKQGQTLLQSLFECDIEDRILLSCHLLGKPTSAQLFRLHSDIIPTLQKVRFLTAKLSKNTDGRLAVIAPIDIEQPYRKLPRVFLDAVATTHRKDLWSALQTGARFAVPRLAVFAP